MHYLMVILTTIILHKFTNAYITNICINDNNCKKFLQEPPFTLPINTTTVHYEDVPIEIINNTFTNKNLISITWVSSNITSVVAVNYNDLQYLNLSKNNITEISEDAFDQCHKLKYIDLSDNKLNVLSDKLFQNTVLLESINIENNIFNSISKYLFKETSNLKNISLGNHNLSILSMNALSNLEKLEYFSIENSGIKSLNKSSFGQHNHLKSIILNNCNNISIENELISSTPNIEIIQLNNCGLIDFLPHSIALLKNLKRLEMSNTQVVPNCQNGWFSQWINNETITDIGEERYNSFIEKMNGLKCPAKLYYISNSMTLHLTKKGIINCKAFGNPLPAITWLVPSGLTFHENKEADEKIKNHPNIHDWDFNQIDSRQSFSIDKNGSLHILRMLRTSIGNYTCYVSNIYGNDSRVTEVHLDSEVFFSIKINALLLGIISALGFLGLTILCCSFKLLLIRLNCIKKSNRPVEAEMGTTEKTKTVPEDV